MIFSPFLFIYLLLINFDIIFVLLEDFQKSAKLKGIIMVMGQKWWRINISWKWFFGFHHKHAVYVLTKLCIDKKWSIVNVLCWVMNKTCSWYSDVYNSPGCRYAHVRPKQFKPNQTRPWPTKIQILLSFPASTGYT